MDDRFLEDLKSQSDIVEVIKRYTEVKKRGKNFMARSPFRNERTPSFSISPDKQVWYDFGASEGGDVISFLEKAENVNFQEAVELLADIVGVEIPKEQKSKGARSGPSRAKKQDLFALHEGACVFFEEQLVGSVAEKYLKTRELSPEVIKKWRLGFGGAAEDGLTKYLLGKGYTQQSISQSGVAFEREFGDKKMRDRFFGRLMIPICDSRGEIIAFGGRDLSGAKKVAKYVNSPENPVYHKSSTLYGLDQARKPILEADKAVLVEGYFDVIAAHQAGFCYTAATCGTALTEDHLRLLKRLTKNIYLAFDSDEAGKKATLRSVEMCLSAQLNPFIVQISGGKDFDELVRKDASALADSITNAKGALQVLMEGYGKKFLNGTLEGEKKFLDHFFTFLHLVERPLEVEHYLNEIAERTNRAPDIIKAEFARFKSQITKPKPKYVKPSAPEKFSRQMCFVGFLSAYWDFFGGKLKPVILDFVHEEGPRRILEQKIEGKELSSEDATKLIAWEMTQENMYPEVPSEDIMKRDFQTFMDLLKTDRVKKDRLDSAKEVREKLGT